ncbi:MAG: Rrf2 family transcriptional regulator [Defluviitaleaceae bacterium]|nr:Rrf2 family transcriptional regulator [Defluviitaleaceae bacterium]
MRISAKGRYALSATIKIALMCENECTVSGVSIAGALGISKIYLEQILVTLKNTGVLISSKGATGGYRLAKDTKEITVWDILTSVESSLCEKADTSVEIPSIEKSLIYAFSTLDEKIKQTLKSISIKDLVDISKEDDTGSFMLHM